MKKILYLHGFASSGASGTVELLRKWFWERSEPAHRAVVVAPDIPLDPLVAEKTLEAVMNFREFGCSITMYSREVCN